MEVIMIVVGIAIIVLVFLIGKEYGSNTKRTPYKHRYEHQCKGYNWRNDPGMPGD